MSGLFATPAMLWWAGAASIPVIIHLLSRRRYKRVAWAAMDFLERAFKRTRRRLRIENLLLMLLRVAILLFLALALANPRVSDSALFGGVGAGSRSVLLVVDTSFSMDARDSADESPFIKAQRMALEVLDGLGTEGDAAALVTTGRPAHLVLPLTRELPRVRETIERMTVTHGATDTIGGLKVTSGLLQEPDLETEFPGPKVVYVFTDMQKAALLDAQIGLDGEGQAIEAVVDSPDPAIERLLREMKDARAEVVFVDVGLRDEELPNVAVTELRHQGKTLVRGVKTQFECTIRNFGETTTAGEVQFFVDQEDSFVQRERITELKGSATGTDATTSAALTFAAEFEAPGWHYVAARFVDDHLKIDNVRRFSFYVRDRIRVLAVNGTSSREPEDAATFFVARALDPFLGRPGATGTTFEVSEISVLDVQSESFDKYDLIVLANVAQMGGAKLGELERYVADGGALFYFCGRTLEVSGRVGRDGGTANQLFFREGKGLLPGRMTRVVGSDEFTDDPYHLQFETFDHPAMAYFEDPKVRPGVTRMPVHKFVEVTPATGDETTRVLASFRHTKAQDTDASAPAILEKTFGRGRVVMFTTSADKTWNYYGASPAFVPLMKEMAYHLTRRPTRSNLVVGENLVERFPPAVSTVTIKSGDEPEQERDTTLSPDQSASEIALPRIEESTVVTMRYTDPAADLPERRVITVNVDPSESDLARGERGWMTVHFGTELLTVVDTLEELVEAGTSEAETGIWKSLLYAVLAFLLLETVLAWRFGRSLTADGATA